MRPLQLLLLALLGLAPLLGCSGAQEPGKDSAAALPPGRKPTLDVPALLNASIDELSQTLGPRRPLPEGFVDPATVPLTQRGAALDSSALFQYRHLRVVATYDHRTRRVLDLLLLGANEEELLEQANLTHATVRYALMPVFDIAQTDRQIGLRVIARPHN